MAKSSDLFNKLGKVLEQSIITYKDISSEIINICKSKRDEFIFKMKIVSKDEFEIQKKRLEKLEKKVDELKKYKKTKKAKKP